MGKVLFFSCVWKETPNSTEERRLCSCAWPFETNHALWSLYTGGFHLFCDRVTLIESWCFIDIKQILHFDSKQNVANGPQTDSTFKIKYIFFSQIYILELRETIASAVDMNDEFIVSYKLTWSPELASFYKQEKIALRSEVHFSKVNLTWNWKKNGL